MPVSTGWGPPICPRAGGCPGIRPGCSARGKLPLAKRVSQAYKGLIDIPPGDDLFSHSVARAVSSALGRLTSVFGMGTGGAAPLEPPGSISTGHEYAPFFTNKQLPRLASWDTGISNRGIDARLRPLSQAKTGHEESVHLVDSGLCQECDGNRDLFALKR